MPRMFVVIPAAGHSRRMGQPKLLLPLAGRTVVERLIEALRSAGLDDIFVLARADDLALRGELDRIAAMCPDAPELTVVSPEPPPQEMRNSVEHLLDAIRQTRRPRPDDAWMLVPADHPVLSPPVLKGLIEAWRREPAGMLVPRCGPTRGHPTIFSWTFAEQVSRIPTGRGLNWLISEFADAVREWPTDDPSVLLDLDTPADYERLLGRAGEGEG